jgi:hypothetical protein
MSASPQSIVIAAPTHVKRPTAVTVVGTLGILAMGTDLLLGIGEMWVLWQNGYLAGFPAQMVCGTTVTDRGDAFLNAVYLIGIGLAILVILYGFFRLRSWAWLALMAWSGLNLAVALFRYYALPHERAHLFAGMALNAVIVLALNQEDVQKAFGIRGHVPEPAVRSAPDSRNRV